MVAGGIGVSPFVAILRDLLQRYQRQQANLPSDVTLIWAVKNSEELQLLDLVSPASICPDYNQKFNLHIHPYITQEVEPVSLEANMETPDTQPQDAFKRSRILSSLYSVEGSKRPMSILVGTGSNLWISCSLLASLFGYIVVTILIHQFIVEPNKKKKIDEAEFSTGLPLWIQGLLNVASMILGVVIFGGSVVALWSIWSRFSSPSSKGDDELSSQQLLDSDDDSTTLANESGDHLVHPSNTHFGHRPNLKGDISRAFHFVKSVRHFQYTDSSLFIRPMLVCSHPLLGADERT